MNPRWPWRGSLVPAAVTWRPASETRWARLPRHPAGRSTGGSQAEPSRRPNRYPGMDRARLVEHLVKAERHVVLGEEHLERQRRVVAERRRHGLNSQEAVELLMRFEQLQTMHVAGR